MRYLPNLDHLLLHQKPPVTHAIPEIHSMQSSNKVTNDAVTILPLGNQNLPAEKHDDEKLAITLLIVKTRLTTYHF